MRNKLSADPAALIMGILSITLLVFGCCCGFITPVTLTLGIIGLVMAQKSLREFEANPENYDFKSRNNVFIGKVLSIIGIVLSALLLIAMVIYFIFVGKMITDENFMKEWRQQMEQQRRERDSVDTDFYKYEDSSAIETDTIEKDTTTEK